MPLTPVGRLIPVALRTPLAAWRAVATAALGTPAITARRTVAAPVSAAVATALAAHFATVAARTTVTAVAAPAFTAALLLLLGRQLFAGGLVDDLHRQTDLAAVIEAEEFDVDFLAFLHHLADRSRPALRQL